VVLELAELRRQLEAELVPEQPSRNSERIQCVALPAGSVERLRQLSAEALVEMMLLDQRLDLADDVGVTTEVELRVEEVLVRGEPVQEERWELDLGEELELASLEWRPAPEGERRPELLHAFDIVASGPRIHNELRKLPEVRLLRRYVQAIARRLFRDPVGAEQ